MQKLRDVVFRWKVKQRCCWYSCKGNCKNGRNRHSTTKLIYCLRVEPVEDLLAKEKLCPVIAIMRYESFDDAVAKAKANLLVEGAGHSAALHSGNDDHIQKAGLELPISRLVINQPSSLTAGGSLTNGFAPTTTLGCGSWGGNSISENLDYKHLMNISRIGKIIEDKVVPTDEEIWA